MNDLPGALTPIGAVLLAEPEGLPALSAAGWVVGGRGRRCYPPAEGQTTAPVPARGGAATTPANVERQLRRTWPQQETRRPLLASLEPRPAPRVRRQGSLRKLPALQQRPEPLRQQEQQSCLHRLRQDSDNLRRQLRKRRRHSQG